MAIRYLDREWEPLPTSASTAGNPILDFALQRGWVDSSGKVVGDNARNIYDAAKQYGVTGTELDQALGWDSGTANAYATSRGWDALQSPRDSLAAQLRAQYNTGAGGSGSWDDAGYDRAKELADLMVKAGVTNLGDLSFKNLEGDVWSAGMDDQGNALPGEWSTGTLGRQLMIGDKAVGYLGDYNNDGTYGNKADTVLKGVGDEALLGWSARGSGNTSYRVVTDPNTGKLVITPGWNSSSDAADFRKAGIFLAGSALGGAGISGSLAGAAGLAGTSGGAALSGAATGAGLNMATTQKLDENTLKAGAIGGLGGYLGHATGINQLASDFAKEYLPSLPSYTGGGADVLVNGGTDAMVGGGTDAILDAAGGMFTDAPTELTGWDAAMADAAKSGAITPEWMAGGSGVNLAGADAWDDVMRAGVDTSYTGQTMPWDLPMDDPNWQPNPADYSTPASGIPNAGQVVEITGSALPTPVNLGGAIGAGIGAAIPQGQTVEIEGKRLTNENDPTFYPGDPFVDSIESQPPSGTQPTTQDPINDGDAPTGQNDPHNDNLDPDGTGPGPVAPGSSFLDWIKANPKLAQVLLGSVLGKIGGDGGGTPAPTGPGTGPQAGMTATPAASLGRRYVPPPPGYRPGFDPEHRYFTGIGAVGTGG